MGDWFQVIVDRDASLSEAEKLAHHLQQWLAEQKIIQSTKTNCVLGENGQGYPPWSQC